MASPPRKRAIVSGVVPATERTGAHCACAVAAATVYTPRHRRGAWDPWDAYNPFGGGVSR
eukprot:6194428-Prymnesium_polylepis.1